MTPSAYCLSLEHKAFYTRHCGNHQPESKMYFALIMDLSLWHNLAMERFYIVRVFLLGFLSVITSKYYHSEFTACWVRVTTPQASITTPSLQLVGAELHLAWNLSADLPDMR